MESKKKINNLMSNKNGFLITCVCSIVLLLTLCYFGINSSFKGTSAASLADYVCLGNKTKISGIYCCPSGYETIMDINGKKYCVKKGQKGLKSYTDVSGSQEDRCDAIKTDGIAACDIVYNGCVGLSKEECDKKRETCWNKETTCTPSSKFVCLYSYGGFTAAYPSTTVDYAWEALESGDDSCKTVDAGSGLDRKECTQCYNTNNVVEEPIDPDGTDYCFQRISDGGYYYGKFSEIAGGTTTSDYSKYRHITKYDGDREACYAGNEYTLKIMYNNGDEDYSYKTKFSSEVQLPRVSPTKKVTLKTGTNVSGATINNNSLSTYTLEFKGWSYSFNSSNYKYTQYSQYYVNGPGWSNFKGDGVPVTGFIKVKKMHGMHNATATLKANWGEMTVTLPTVEKEGYVCGWNDGKGPDSAIMYASGGSYNINTATSKEVILDVICQEDNSKYYVYYHKGDVGSDTVTNLPSTAQFGEGQPMNVSATIPERAGYVFLNWNTQIDGKGTTYLSGGTDPNVNLTSANAITLYAIWKKSSTETTIKVTFDANGGSVTTSDKTVTVGSTYGTLPMPTYSGYDFDGWFTQKTGGSKVTSSTSVTLSVAHTLYAHWTKTGGTEVVTGGICSGSVEYNYTGWDKNGDGLWTVEGNNNECNDAAVSGKLSVWNSNDRCCLIRDRYSINYNYNGGKKGGYDPNFGIVDGQITTELGYYGYDYVSINYPSKKVIITGNQNNTGADVGAATSANQTFAGWTFNGNTSSAKYGTSSSSITTVWSSTSTKVKAKYFRNLTNVSGATVMMTAHWTPVSLYVPTLTSPSGYTCVWNTKSDGSGRTYTSGEQYTPTENSEANITLYARCAKNDIQEPTTKVATIPTAASYCQTLTYNKTTQTLTKAAGDGYTFSNNTRVNAGSQKVRAVLMSGYQWTDGTTTYKEFSCSIAKANPTLSLAEYRVSLTEGGSSSVDYSYDGDGIVGCDSRNTSIAVCEEKNGKLVITAKAAGITEILLTATSGINYNSSSTNAVSVTVVEDTSDIPKEEILTATFNANGGVLSGGNNRFCKKTSSSCDVTDLPTATRDGYTFKGWGIENTCNSGEKEKISLNKDTTYYACWVKVDNTPSVDENGNVEDNVQTGNVVIMLVLCLGLLAMGYAYYYFKSIKQN